MTSDRARTALAERIAASPVFAKSLQRPEAYREGEDEQPEEDEQVDAVVYDEIDSSRMIDEEITNLVLQEPGHLLADQPDAESDNEDHQVIGENMGRFTGQEFSSRAATNSWMDWDATSHM